jgi:glycosyltransferase involved in cell wall biosynthesis
MPLNVLHVDSEYGWRGGQQQLAYLATAMRTQGDRGAVVCQPDSHMTRFCHTNQIKCYPIRMHGEIDVLAAFKIARLAQREKFNILHLHSGHAVTLGLWARLFNAKLTLIATRRVDFRLRSRLFSRLKYKNPWLSKIVCVSEEIARIMRSDGIDGHRVTTIYSGVDLLKYSQSFYSKDFKTRWGISDKAFIVGTIAAMVGHKDYPTLLRAARLVVDRRPQIVFLAVGDGPLEREIRMLADQLNLGQRFIFCGYQDNIGDFLKNFDLFVLSSNQEGLGTSILDAQAAGIPVVACAAGGIPEMIQDGINGYLVPKETPAALAQAIIALADDADQRQRLIQAAYKSVANFSIEKTVRKYIELYESVLKRD